MGPIGAQEMFFIVLLALLLFGPKKLPELGRMLGKGLTEFRRAKNELKSTFESHMQELDREARLSEQAETAKKSSTPDQPYPSASYPYPYDEYGRESPAAAPEPEHVAPAGTVPRTKTEPPPADAIAHNDTASTGRDEAPQGPPPGENEAARLSEPNIPSGGTSADLGAGRESVVRASSTVVPVHTGPEENRPA